MVARYAQGQNIDEILAMQRGSTTSYYEADGVNSITSLSNTSGALAQNYTYDSFGNTIGSSGSLTNFFRYTGREFDTETNLYDYRARYYDSSTGRFLNPDPLWPYGGINGFVYALNDPVLWIDPFGYCVSPWDRLRLFGEALGNIGVGVAKVAVAAGAAAGAPETGGLSLGLTYYAGASGLGNIGAGISQALGAATGDVSYGQLGAAAIESATSVSGLVTTIYTGDVNAGAEAANVEGLLLLPVGLGAGIPDEVPDILKPVLPKPAYPLAGGYDTASGIGGLLHPTSNSDANNCGCN